MLRPGDQAVPLQAPPIFGTALRRLQRASDAAIRRPAELSAVGTGRDAGPLAERVDERGVSEPLSPGRADDFDTFSDDFAMVRVDFQP